MYKITVFILLLNLSLCHAFLDSSSLCDHDFCEPNGVCRPNSVNGTYTCKCKSNFRGQHCEIEDCLTENCKMAVDYCNAYPKVNCQNNGQCVNTARGFRCQCTNGFEGKYCDEKKVPVYLPGDIVIVLDGPKDKIVENLDKILFQIGDINNITVHVQVDKQTQKSIVYSLNDENELENFNANVGERQRRSAKSEEVLLVLNIEITKCLKKRQFDSTIQCPETLSSALTILQQNGTNEIFQSMGIQILRVFIPNVDVEQRVEIETQLILVFVLTMVIILLVILIACLVNRERNYKRNLDESEFQSFVSVISSNKDLNNTPFDYRKDQTLGNLFLYGPSSNNIFGKSKNYYSLNV